MHKLYLTIALSSLFVSPALSPAQTPAAPAAPSEPPAATSLPKPPTDIEFILDASGSMEALLGGESQMAVAKRSLKEAVAAIAPGTSVALRVYAHRVPKTDQAASCQDTELLIPFQPLNPAAFTAAVDAVQPKGYTPIAYSLRAAAGDFLGKESQHVLILLSDGEETCGGDPVAEAKNLIAQGFKVNIHTIGFRVDEKTRAQLSAVSQATGGQYFDATDAASLTQNLVKATQKALLIDKPAEEVKAREIRGGHQYSDAVALTPGVEYRLDHHQRGQEYDYFYVDVKRSQGLSVTVTTTNQGVRVNGEKVEENTMPNAGFRLDDAQFQQVKNATIHGAHQRETVRVVPQQDGRYYILVGSYYDMHRNSPFKVELENYFDAGLNQDAGPEPASAVPVNPGEYASNWITAREDQDAYQIQAKAGRSYSMVVTPKDMEGAFEVTAFDSDRVRLLSKNSPNPGAVLRVEGIKPQRDGPLYLIVGSNSFTSPHPILPYAFALSEEAGSAPQSQTALSAQPEPATEAQPAAEKISPDGSAKKGLIKILVGVGAVLVLLIIGLVAILVTVLKKKKT